MKEDPRIAGNWRRSSTMYIARNDTLVKELKNESIHYFL